MAETGTYTFRWEHPADEVFVTGTFDDWSKSIKLDRNADGVFEKSVDLPKTDESVYYKFVKDGEWVTSHTAPTETDSSGNTNNVLRPDAIISSAAPASSTAAMTATDTDSTAATAASTPGTFPETPAFEKGDFGVNPIPASEGPGNPIDLKPGEKVPAFGTINRNTITSGVHDDPELKAADEAKQVFSVNPIPASSGFGNPIDLKPGDKVPPPSDFTASTVNSTVKLDKASYENSDAMPTDAVPTTTESDANLFNLPPVGGTMIPESSLPMGTGTGGASGANAIDRGFTIQSAGPQSSTAGLAARVPLEKNKVDPLEQEFGDATLQSVGPQSTTAGLAARVPLEKENGKLEKEFGDLTIQSVGPQSTTAGLAAGVPLEKNKVDKLEQEFGDATLQSVGPQSTTAGLAARVPLEKENGKLEKEFGQSTIQSVGPDSSTAALAAKVPPATPAKDASSLAAPLAQLKQTSLSRDVSPKSNPAGPPGQTGSAGPVTPASKKEGSVGRRVSAVFKGFAAGVTTPESAGGKKDKDADKGAAAAPSSSAGESAAKGSGGKSEGKGKGKRMSFLGKIKEAFK